MKIPFEPTITGAYRFVFSNILSILGIGWFPFLLVAIVIGAVAVEVSPLFVGLIIEGTNHLDTARLGAVIGRLIGAFVLVMAVTLIAQSMVNVGLMRLALGRQSGPVYFFFSLGTQVWQMIASYLLLMFLVWGAIALAGAVIATLAIVLQKALAAAIPLIALLVIGCYAGVIYAIFRAMFFIPAVVVAENHIGLRRSWHLGKGNFWRIVGVFIVVLMPLGLAMSTITQVIMQIVVGSPARLSPQATPAETQAFFEKIMGVFVKIGPYFAVLEVLYVILLSGLLIGAIAAAYRTVAGSETALPQAPV